MHDPPLEMVANSRGGSYHHPPLKIILGADDGMTRLYKWSHTNKFIIFYIISDEVKLYIKILEVNET